MHYKAAPRVLPFPDELPGQADVKFRVTGLILKNDGLELCRAKHARPVVGKHDTVNLRDHLFSNLRCKHR